MAMRGSRIRESKNQNITKEIAILDTMCRDAIFPALSGFPGFGQSSGKLK